MNEGRVYFSLDGSDFEPDEVTKFLGMEPTSVIYKGSIVPDKIPEVNSWIVSTGNIINEHIDVYEMSRTIVDKLKPIKQQLLDSKKRFNLDSRFEVVVFVSTEKDSSMPAIGFDADTVQFLAELGAYIDIDTYQI
ncbi:DUF4279 domain-containing protein [Vibrio mimicus]|uniref:DUF4279 domain-containing protein n=1 Tax=Vibrio mimicus TaxID=674 RepID=UPI000ABCD544|nr:DUF4279 domain-containing protein [Vibrio mimicus]